MLPTSLSLRHFCCPVSLLPFLQLMFHWCLNPHPVVFLLHAEMETLPNDSFSFSTFLLFWLKCIQGGSRRRDGKGRVRSRLPKQFPFPYRAQLISFQSRVHGKLHISPQCWLSWNWLSQSTATRSGPESCKHERVNVLPPLTAAQKNKQRLMWKGEGVLDKQPQGGNVERK